MIVTWITCLIAGTAINKAEVMIAAAELEREVEDRRVGADERLLDGDRPPIPLDLPLAVVGSLTAMAITQTPFTIFSMLGFALLVGLVGKNAILPRLYSRLPM